MFNQTVLSIIHLANAAALDSNSVGLLDDGDVQGIRFGYVDNLMDIIVSHLSGTDFETLEGLIKCKFEDGARFSSR